MKRTTCPYLGLKDDPTTALSFPSPGNYCHQARPVAPVKGAYQERYCLTRHHTACTLYQATHPMPLPASIAARTIPVFSRRQVIALVGVPVVVVAMAVFVLIINNFGSQIAALRHIPNTGSNLGDNNFGLIGAGPAPTLTPFSSGDIHKSPQVPKKNCPLPAGWTAYNVSPTDSLFRLSVIYGVSVEDLQRVNCMGGKTVILPGQIIYVPFIPTNTPINTIVIQPQIPQTNTSVVISPLPRVSNTPQPTVQPSATKTVLPTNSKTPTHQPTVTPKSTNTPPPTATDQPPTLPPPPTNTLPPSTTPPPPPTDTPLPPPPTDTPLPLPTNTPPAPTATDQPTAIPATPTNAQITPTLAATAPPLATSTTTP